MLVGQSRTMPAYLWQPVQNGGSYEYCRSREIPTYCASRGRSHISGRRISAHDRMASGLGLACHWTIHVPANDSWDLRDTGSISTHCIARPTRQPEPDLVYRMVEHRARRNYGRTINRIPRTSWTSVGRRPSARNRRRCSCVAHAAPRTLIDASLIGALDSGTAGPHEPGGSV